MPYLNWKDRPTVTQAAVSRAEVIGAHGAGYGGEGGLRMTLGLDAQSRQDLHAALSGVLSPLAEGASPYVSRELRLDLPRGWSVFWKLRDGDSRLLVAHPQENEWVATAALSDGFAPELLTRVAALRAGESIDVGELARQSGHALGAVSNLELVLEALAGA